MLFHDAHCIRDWRADGDPTLNLRSGLGLVGGEEIPVCTTAKCKQHNDDDYCTPAPLIDR